MRFAVNISLLFSELPFLQRFEAVARAGFGAVEFWWPPADALPGIESAVKDAGLEVVLINFDAGDMAAGDRGLLSNPQRHAIFRANVPDALELASCVGCTRLNALVGLTLPTADSEEQFVLARDNVAWAADQAAEIDASVLIEALNTIDNGPYLLPNTSTASSFVRSVDRPNVKLQYDVYQVQRMEGNLAATLTAHIDEIAHIQIADSPHRSEPGTGEINFDFILRLIDRLGYTGWVSLEYRPSTGSTENSLAWLPVAARPSTRDHAQTTRNYGARPGHTA